jgi:hypothetical protein
MAISRVEKKVSLPGGHETEYQVIHQQRLAVIRSYNLWYAFGHFIAHSYFWLLLNLSLTLSSRPLMIATAITASLMIFFAYRVVLIIDRGVVGLYPRIIFLELGLDYDFYRDYLRRRHRGDTERSFIERCESINTDKASELWNQVYSLFNEKDFPADRRITAHFKWAAYLSVVLFWVIVGMIIVPDYFPWR